MLHLGRHVNDNMFELVTSAEAQEVRIVLRSRPKVKGVEKGVFKAALQVDARAFSVFLQLTLGDKTVGKLISQPETHDDGEAVLVEGLELEWDWVEQIGAEPELLCYLRLQSEFKAGSTSVGIVTTPMQQ